MLKRRGSASGRWFGTLRSDAHPAEPDANNTRGHGRMTRDFLGYNDNPQDIRWPGDAGMAVSVVLNIEEGAELSINDGDESNFGEQTLPLS